MSTGANPGTDSFRTCEHCGAWNDAGATVCRECGKSVRGEDDYDISFGLTFAAETCPGCGKVSPAGTCSICGANVPATSEVSKAAAARRAAFSPLLDRVEKLLARYDHIPDPHIRVSSDQYAATLADGRLFKRLRVSLRFPRKHGGFDFDDTAEIGGRIRREVSSFVGQLEQIYRETEELAWFVPPAPEVAHARQVIIATGRYGTEPGSTVSCAGCPSGRARRMTS